MLIVCPRCGFEQPKDQFCAKCGVDIDHFKVKPQPALIRLLQNPNFHLSLIGILIVAVIGYIFYSQRLLVSRQVGKLLDLPVSSRDAADPNDPGHVRAAAPAATRAFTPKPQPEPPGPTAALAPDAQKAATAPADDANKASAEVKISASNKLEVANWEVPREALANLIPLGEKLGESGAGRAYLYPSGAKVAEQIQSVGQRLSQGRTVAARAGSQITMETPSTTTEAFQFGMLFQITKVEGKDLTLKWDAQFVLPQVETAAEAASGTPSVRSTVQSALSGSATLTTAALLLIMVEPTNRSPRDEFLVRAGEGPWTVFASPDFRAGLTEWVMLVTIK